MSALAEPSDNRTRPTWRPSLTGIRLIFRHQMHGRNAWRDLAITVVLLPVLLALAAILQRMWIESGEYSHSVLNFLARWLATGVALIPFVLLPLAAVLGAKSVPAREEFEQTQSILLTQLTAFDLAGGRLLAGLWPVSATLLGSTAFWLAAQLGWRFAKGPLDGYGPLLLAHFVLLCAVFMIGSIGFLFATCLRPRRAWGRGTGVALVWSVLCVGGILMANPLIQLIANGMLPGHNDPYLLIEGLLTINPVTAATTALGPDLDILRTPWLYDRSVVHDYAFTYPMPLITAGIFMAVGLVASVLSALRLRRAYR